MTITLRIEILKVFKLDFSMASGKSKQEESTNAENNNINSGADKSKPKS